MRTQFASLHHAFDVHEPVYSVELGMSLAEALKQRMIYFDDNEGMDEVIIGNLSLSECFINTTNLLIFESFSNLLQIVSEHELRLIDDVFVKSIL